MKARDRASQRRSTSLGRKIPSQGKPGWVGHPLVWWIVEWGAPDENPAWDSERQPTGSDAPAFRAGRVAHPRKLAVVLCFDRGPGDRVHADPRAGNGPLRGTRRARCRPDRARLGDREWP